MIAKFQKTIAIATMTILAALFGFGCGDDDDTGDSGADAASDAGADGSSDTDTDTDEEECNPEEPAQPTEDYFEDISEASGIQDQNFDTDPESDPWLPRNHHIIQFADLNGDGWDDVIMHNFFTEIASENGALPEVAHMDHLVFLNNKDGTFANISDQTGFREVFAQAFAYGDIDNDGDQDIFAAVPEPVTPAQQHTVWLNNGDGTFTEKTGHGITGTTPCCYTTGAVFADFNNDAKLDLFLANGFSFRKIKDQLFFGNGDGTFSDSSSKLEGNGTRYSNAAHAMDFDVDGDLDIFVSMYGVSDFGGHNVLWQNDGSGNFVNVAVEKGYAYQTTGNYYLSSTGYGTDIENPDDPDAPVVGYVGSNGFALVSADINNDGYLDLYNATISHPVSSDYSRKWSDPTTLLINQGPEQDFAFVNEFLERDLVFNEGDIEASAQDFDNDGLIDLAVGRDAKYEPGYLDIEHKGWTGIHHQLADGTFENESFQAGINDPDDATYRRGHNIGSHTWSDIDHDGDLDFLWGAYDEIGTGRPAFLFRNNIGQDNPWLAVRVEGDGTSVNADGIGTRVTITLDDDTKLTRHVYATRGNWTGADTRVLHFGSPYLECSFTATVDWPDGTQATLTSDDLPVNHYVRLVYPDLIEIE